MALLAAVAVDELEVLVFKGQKHWDRVQRGWTAPGCLFLQFCYTNVNSVCAYIFYSLELIQYVHTIVVWHIVQEGKAFWHTSVRLAGT